MDISVAADGMPVMGGGRTRQQTTNDTTFSDLKDGASFLIISEYRTRGDKPVRLLLKMLISERIFYEACGGYNARRYGKGLSFDATCSEKLKDLTIVDPTAKVIRIDV